MLPTVNILGVGISAYGFFVVVSFVLGTIWAGHRAKAAGLNPNHCPQMTFWMFVSALPGAKIFSFVNNLNKLGYNPDTLWEDFASAGLVAYGGIIFALIAMYIYKLIKKIDIVPYLDTFAPAAALGLCLIRLGCFFNGCCFGKESFSIIAVSFPERSVAGAYQLEHGMAALFPSQLLASFDGFIILSLLLLLRKQISFRGGATLFFLTGAAVSRFIVDFTRKYDTEEVSLFLSFNQWICLGFIIAGVIWFFVYRRSANECLNG